jgi:hypothetical protein
MVRILTRRKVCSVLEKIMLDLSVGWVLSPDVVGSYQMC